MLRGPLIALLDFLHDAAGHDIIMLADLAEEIHPKQTQRIFETFYTFRSLIH